MYGYSPNLDAHTNHVLNHEHEVTDIVTKCRALRHNHDAFETFRASDDLTVITKTPPLLVLGERVLCLDARLAEELVDTIEAMSGPGLQRLCFDCRVKKDPSVARWVWTCFEGFLVPDRLCVYCDDCLRAMEVNLDAE